jgi:hypothetical protein
MARGLRVHAALGVWLLLALPAAAQTARVLRVEPPRIVIELESGARLRIGSARVLSFALYREKSDLRPAWSAVQTIAPHGAGRFRVVLGIGSEDDFPAALLAGCAPVWLEVEGRQPAIRLPLARDCGRKPPR